MEGGLRGTYDKFTTLFIRLIDNKAPLGAFIVAGEEIELNKRKHFISLLAINGWLS